MRRSDGRRRESTWARIAGSVAGACLCAGQIACASEDLQSSPAPIAEEPPDDPQAAAEACRADAESFVLRTMPLLHGRRPLGSTELRLLGSVVDQLEARGLDGRRMLAQALADGDDYRRRLGSVLLDLLKTRRAGHHALEGCYGNRGPAAESDALARFVLEHAPDEPFPEGPFSMRDLVESSLRLDDLRPVLRADLLVRMSSTIDDANTPPDQLERSRRTALGRAFETVYLGRRFECLSCHRDDASVTDHPDPALDRFWPVARGLERLVYPDDEAALHASFRWEGFSSGEQAPWGAASCGRFTLGHDDDPLPVPAFLGGALPPGAHALDVMQRLDEGLRRLAADGWSDAPSDGSVALAQLVVLHLCDGLWAAANGTPLTLDHGTPRNAAQAERLRALAITLVRSGYSLRAVLVEIAVDPHVDQANPAECELSGPEPLPALFDPFMEHNGAGHRLHRRDPFALYDEAHRVLGQPLPGLVAGQPGFDAERVASLGAHLDESMPGHGGLDLVGALSWERALLELAQPPEPPPAEDSEAPPAEPDAGPSVTLDDLVEAVLADPSSTVGDLLVATKDRVLTEPHVDEQERALVEALVGQAWTRPAAELPAASLRAIASRYARTLMATPEFLLEGLEQAPQGEPPRQWPHQAGTHPLCAHWGARVLPGEAYSCTDLGLVLR